MKNIVFIITLLAASILQAAVLPEMSVMDNHYEIFFAITIFFSIKYSWYEGCISGIWCGLLNDVFSLGPFGMSVFVFSISGFIASFFQKIIFTQHIATRLFILFIMSIVATIITIFLMNDLSFIFRIWSTYKLNILSIASVNTIFSIPVYHILDKVSYDDRR